MEYRTLGKTGLKISALSFGRGAAGGLMVKGTALDQDRAVVRAMESGINYFDTAAMYGNGKSERNLGRVPKNSDRPKVYVGTKAALPGRASPALELFDQAQYYLLTAPPELGKPRLPCRHPATQLILE